MLGAAAYAPPGCRACGYRPLKVVQFWAFLMTTAAEMRREMPLPPRPDLAGSLVLDKTGQVGDAADLTEMLRGLPAEVLLAVVPTVGANDEEGAADAYARALYDKWECGPQGILVVLAVREPHVGIAVGARASELLSESEAEVIVETVELRVKIEGIHVGTRNVIDLLRIELDMDGIPGECDTAAQHHHSDNAYDFGVTNLTHLFLRGSQAGAHRS